MAINVLEHIENDHIVLKQLFRILAPKRKLIVLVPAHLWLYSNFDRILGHYRRYTIKELRNKLNNAGFNIEKLEYTNTIAAILWWLNFCILKSKNISLLAAKMVDSIIPVIHLIERVINPPVGLNLFCVANAPEKKSV